MRLHEPELGTQLARADPGFRLSFPSGGEATPRSVCSRNDGILQGMGHEDEDLGNGANSEDKGDGGTGLTEAEVAILELERAFWKYPGAKEATIHARFGRTRYYQVLNALIDRPDALAADPVTVNRLRRLREKRQRKRSAPSNPRA